VEVLDTEIMKFILQKYQDNLWEIQKLKKSENGA